MPQWIKVAAGSVTAWPEALLKALPVEAFSKEGAMVWEVMAVTNLDLVSLYEMLGKEIHVGLLGHGRLATRVS